MAQCCNKGPLSAAFVPCNLPGDLFSKKHRRVSKRLRLIKLRCCTLKLVCTNNNLSRTGQVQHGVGHRSPTVCRGCTCETSPSFGQVLLAPAYAAFVLPEDWVKRTTRPLRQETAAKTMPRILLVDIP